MYLFLETFNVPCKVWLAYFGETDTSDELFYHYPGLSNLFISYAPGIYSAVTSNQFGNYSYLLQFFFILCNSLYLILFSIYIPSSLYFFASCLFMTHSRVFFTGWMGGVPHQNIPQIDSFLAVGKAPVPFLL